MVSHRSTDGSEMDRDTSRDSAVSAGGANGQGDQPRDPDGGRGRELAAVRGRAGQCRACSLYLRATQTVFGAGPTTAQIVVVGEQPGDQEDRQGIPFVGPAGRELEAALTNAGIPLATVYITNAVKHFKWVARGRRRIHQRPTTPEIRACRPWLTEELDIVRPRAVVCLGATAARAVLGRPVTIATARGQPIDTPTSPWVVIVTVHPASLLRIPDARDRADARASFVADLRLLQSLTA